MIQEITDFIIDNSIRYYHKLFAGLKANGYGKEYTAHVCKYSHHYRGLCASILNEYEYKED